MDPLRYVLALGPATRTVYTLTGESLEARTEGGVGARNVTVPLAQLRQFAVLPPVRASHSPRGAIVRAGQAYAGAWQLALVWEVEGRTRRTRLQFHEDPSFRQFVERLVLLRPAASLIGLAPDEARRKMGFWSVQAQSALVVVAVLVVAVVAEIIKLKLGY